MLPGGWAVVDARGDAAREVVLVDGSWLTAAAGALVLLFTLAVLACVFPPAIVGLLGLLALTAFSTLMVLVSGTAFDMAGAVASGDLDSALALPALVYAAQYVGRAYLSGGLAGVRADVLVAGVVPELIKDADYMVQVLGDRPVCAGLVTPFCLPAPQRGVGPLARLAGALQCEQGAACSTLADCPGRAKGCVAGRCYCWLYLPETIALPTLDIGYTDDIACEAYGYTNRGLVARQTGGVSWTNVANTWANFWAGAGDVLAALCHRKLPPAVLGVAVLAFVPFVRSTGATLTRAAVAGLAAQAALAYANDGLGWVAPRGHGVSCALLASPSIALWTMALYWGAVAVSTLFAAGVFAALLGVLLALAAAAAGAVTWLARRAQPYVRWYQSDADAPPSL